jgi:hypothetical protein
MTHPKSEIQKVGDIEIKCRSFNTDVQLYRSIGGEVEVRREEKKRRWWCAGLCKTKVKAEADSIEIENTYFATVNDFPIPVQAAHHEGVCSNSSDCKLHHSAGGILADIKFPDGGISPGPIDDLLSLKGVVTRARVTIDGRMMTFTTAAGLHPI